jgi:hypothetical protein
MRVTDAILRASLLAAATFLSLALPVAAQAPPQPAPPQPAPALPSELLANLARLRDAALASDYAFRQVAHLTENWAAARGIAAGQGCGRLCGRGVASART